MFWLRLYNPQNTGLSGFNPCKMKKSALGQGLARYNLYYCWSDGGILCSVGGIVHEPRRELAPVGGGTSANVSLDVPCTPGKARWLSIRVWTPGFGTVSSSDVYSLFYSVEGVDDGFTYFNGSGGDPPKPGIGPPVNP